MAEYGNVSIVSSDDVKGNVTLSMKNVPWEQALDTILDVNSLAKKQTGNIITVTTLERKKKDEADRVKAADDQNKAEDERKAREQKMLAEKGLLKQVLIEAKIVEATRRLCQNYRSTMGFWKSAEGQWRHLWFRSNWRQQYERHRDIKSIFTSLSLSNWRYK